MTQRGRFQIKSLVVQQGEVRCHSGLDPLTGLPVLIYTFPGRLAPSLGDLESENIAGILASSFDGKEGQLVVAHAREQKVLRGPVAEGEVLALLVDTSRALKDAAQAGILHGDLKPERFVKDGSRYLLEGYGVRWQPQASPFAAPDAQREASYAGDVYAWAKSVAYLCGPHLPKELGPLMKACLSLEPPHRPLAKTIHDIISDVSRDTASGEGGNGNGDAVSYHQTAATPREDARLARAPYREAGQEALQSGSTARTGSAAAAIPAPQAPTPAHAANEDPVKGGAPPRPMRLPREVAGGGVTKGGVTKGGVTKGGVTKDSAAKSSVTKSSAAKNLPPPAPVAAAQSGLPHKLAAKRRPLLLAALGLTVILFAYLSLRQAPPNPPPQPASYLVNISVTPDGLRGVRLTVVSSPPGSQHQPGSQFTNLPGWVVFDREGLWVLRASVNSRAAEVSIRVPQERYVTVDFPD